MDFSNEMVIAKTTSASTVIVMGGVGLKGTPRCITAVGVMGSVTVKIQIPVVTDPSPTNDAHWQDQYQDGELSQLSAYNHQELIPANLEYRLVKSAGNSVGVRWS